MRALTLLPVLLLVLAGGLLSCNKAEPSHGADEISVPAERTDEAVGGDTQPTSPAMPETSPFEPPIVVSEVLFVQYEREGNLNLDADAQDVSATIFLQEPDEGGVEVTVTSPDGSSQERGALIDEYRLAEIIRLANESRIWSLPTMVVGMGEPSMTTVTVRLSRTPYGNDFIGAVWIFRVSTDEGVPEVYFPPAYCELLELLDSIVEQAQGLDDVILDYIERLRDEDEDVRAEAVYWLGEIGDPSAVPALIECLSSEDEEDGVRYVAATALGFIGDVSAVPELEKLAGDENVGWAAQLAIDRIRAAQDED